MPHFHSKTDETSKGPAQSLDTDESCAALSPGTELLRGQYRIVRQIGQGGFGLTYLAHDSLNRAVVIKECFASQICQRVGMNVHPLEEENAPFFSAILEQFQAEAHRLAGLDHPGIVRVHQTFAENGTAYTAMDLVEGVDLIDLVDHTPGRLTPGTVDGILRQVLDALRYLHDRGILHRDIAPDNLILGEDGHVTLIDFGAAYSFDETDGGQNRRMLAVKDGYSPPEFYSADGAQGAHSDMYSLGALCHLIFTGEAPPDAQCRAEMVAAGQMDPYVPLELASLDFDIRLRLATDRALSQSPTERLQCADDWIAVLDGPIPKPPPVFDPAIIGVIEDLVKTTNSALTPSLPRALRQTLKHLEPSRPDPIRPKQYVDIFGDPIDDVEAYLNEQDKLCHAHTGRQKPLLKQIDYASAGTENHEHAGVVGSIFRRFRSRFKADPTARDTRIFQT